MTPEDFVLTEPEAVKLMETILAVQMSHSKELNQINMTKDGLVWVHSKYTRTGMLECLRLLAK